MSFWQGSVGGEEVMEVPFSQKIAGCFFGARQERVKSIDAFLQLEYQIIWVELLIPMWHHIDYFTLFKFSM